MTSAVRPNQLPTIETGVHTAWPSCWSQTQDERLIRVNGLQRGTIWNGLDQLWALGITAPASAPSVGTSGSGYGALEATYVCGYRYLDADGNPSSISEFATVTPGAGERFDWAAIPAADDDDADRITTIELWRSTGDQSTVIYRVQTRAYASRGNTFADEASDATLRAYDTDQIMPVNNADGTLHARRFEPPPDHKTVVIQFQDRWWYLAEAQYRVGYVKLTNLAVVTGYGTQFTSAMAGRHIWIEGAVKAAEILTVGSETSLLLAENAADATISAESFYCISKAADEMNRLYYSEVHPTTGESEPESVPTVNAIDVQDNTDDPDSITGAFPHGSVLWVMKERHAYRLRFVVNPGIDGSVKLAASRGMLNQQCWAFLGDTVYVLDQYGPWWIGPEGSAVVGGGPVADYFGDPRIDWSRRDWFFVTADPNDRTVRFHVVLEADATDRPKAAICYHADSQSWWLETYPIELVGAAVAHTGVRTHVLVGGPRGTAYVLGDGTADMASTTGIAFTDGEGLWDSGRGGGGFVRGWDLRYIQATTGLFVIGAYSGRPWARPPEVPFGTGYTALILDGAFTSYPAAPEVGAHFTVSNDIHTYRILDYIDDDGLHLTGRVASGPETYFTTSAIGNTVTIANGAAAGETAVVMGIYATVLTFANDLPESDSVPYWSQTSLIGACTDDSTSTRIATESITFPEQLEGTPIAIIEGTGKGQMSYVADDYTSGHTYLDLNPDYPFDPAPDSSSRFMLGAIRCTYQSGRMELPVTRDVLGKAPQPGTQREVIIDYEPTSEDLLLNVQLTYDHETSPVTFPQPHEDGAVEIHAGTDEVVVSMERTRSPLQNAPGRVRIPFHGRAGARELTHRFLAVGFDCFQGPEEIAICALEIEGGE